MFVKFGAQKGDLRVFASCGSVGGGDVMLWKEADKSIESEWVFIFVVIMSCYGKRFMNQLNLNVYSS